MRLVFLSAICFCFLITNHAVAQASEEWQQNVSYDMEIHLMADRHQMRGFQRLTYYNNSPDPLHRVYYHLYFNAFNPNSQMAERNRILPDPDPRVVPRIFNLGPEEVGYHRIESLTYNGRPVPFTVYDTVMEVELDQPIPPGGEAEFEMQFHSQVPLQTRRSGRDNAEGIDYSMAQWYPKMAMYDERGWHADPYIGREFYAPFGTFDVRITLPSEYVIGATGVLQNPEEIGHGYADGATQPRAAGDSLTWHFVAENVHDFAWAADPDYIHDRFTDELGITYHLLYQPDVAPAWQGLREQAPAIIQFMSEHYGRYPWPQFTVAQAADGGMEYPMMTLITGRRSPGSVLGVTAHEAAHMWYYGALGTNEADYAWIDEGFANYTSTEAVAHVTGQPRANHTGAALGVIAAKYYGYFEPLNTPSDWFVTNAAYGVSSYSGGQTLVNTMGYVISEPLRDRWLLELFERYRFRHPDPSDIEKVAEDVSGIRLDWYFEQFLNGRDQLDYGVEGLSSEAMAGGGWRATVQLRRLTEFAMPVDLVIEMEDGSYQWVNVPLSLMQGHKPVPQGWMLAEPWAWAYPDYTLTIELPSRPVDAIIDPLLLTPDADRLNNAADRPLNAAFLRPPVPTWTTYGVGYRPLGQYARDFGFGAGIQARGEYIFNQHELKAMLKLWPEVIVSGGNDPAFNFLPGADATVLDGIDYEIGYGHPLPWFGPYVRGMISLQKHLNILENEVAVQAQLGRLPLFAERTHTLTAGLRHQYRPGSRAFYVYPGVSFTNRHLVSAFADFEMERGADRLRVALEAGSTLERMDDVTSDFLSSATRLTVDAAKTAALGPFTGYAGARFGVGANRLAWQKRFRLGGATVEEAWRNDAFRTISSMVSFNDQRRFVAFPAAGPVAYNSLFPRSGSHTFAGTLALHSGPFANSGLLAPLTAELFAGAGSVWNGNVLDGLTELDDYLADAGIGVTYDVPALGMLSRWTAQSDVLSTLRLSAKFPLWMSDPQTIGESDAFDFRWMLGIEVGR